jgi:FkbM family methyltransferase
VITSTRGFQLNLDPAELVDCALLFFPDLYDAVELRYLEEHLVPGDVFVDAGAHIGLYALVASRLVGQSGHVLAIEPNPVTHERLRANLNINHITNVLPLRIGLSDRDEILRLSTGFEGCQGASTFLRVTEQGVEVTCRPLLGLLMERGITQVRGAKFDIEGFEYRVLGRFLAEAEPDLLPEFIFVEFHPEWVSLAGGNVLELLARHGYRVVGSEALNYILERAR